MKRTRRSFLRKTIRRVLMIRSVIRTSTPPTEGPPSTKKVLRFGHCKHQPARFPSCVVHRKWEGGQSKPDTVQTAAIWSTCRPRWSHRGAKSGSHFSQSTLSLSLSTAVVARTAASQRRDLVRFSRHLPQYFADIISVSHGYDLSIASVSPRYHVKSGCAH